MKISIFDLNQINVWIDQFESLRLKILKSNDRKKINYSTDNLKIDSQDAASIVFVNDKIAAFSFLYSQKNWHKTSRTLSRYYITPEFRASFFDVRNQFTNLMLLKQVEVAISFQKDFVFISREYPALGWLKSIYNNPNNKFKWQTDQNFLYQTCYSDSAECWQHCVWLQLGHSKNFPLPSKLIKEI